MSFPNVHRDLVDAELHVPKGFAGAAVMTRPIKTRAGELDWTNENGGVCWDCPVLDVVDGNLPPPTAADGDRYIVVSIGNTLDADWGSIAFNDIVQRVSIAGTSDWVGLTPIHGSTVYDRSRDGYWFFDGTNWQGYDFMFEVDIASADVLTLNSSPVTLVEDPLITYAAQLYTCAVELDYNTTPYATNTTLLFCPSGSVVVGSAQYTDGVILPETADGISIPAEQGGIRVIKGDGIVLSVNAGDPTAGDSPIKVTGKYRLIR